MGSFFIYLEARCRSVTLFEGVCALGPPYTVASGKLLYILNVAILCFTPNLDGTHILRPNSTTSSQQQSFSNIRRHARDICTIWAMMGNLLFKSNSLKKIVKIKTYIYYITSWVWILKFTKSFCQVNYWHLLHQFLSFCKPYSGKHIVTYWGQQDNRFNSSMMSWTILLTQSTFDMLWTRIHG